MTISAPSTKESRVLNKLVASKIKQHSTDPDAQLSTWPVYGDRSVFCPDNENPFDTVEWDKRSGSINDAAGNAIIKYQDIEAPKNWSDQAVKIVASKYLYGRGTDRQEKSIKNLIHRVANTVANWGLVDKYFDSTDERDAFYKDIVWLCLHQYAAFNSPVWFNVGLAQQLGVSSNGGGKAYNYTFGRAEENWEVDPYLHPQCSACFILSIDDSINGIWQYATDSARLFKFGSGVGADWSSLRGTCETLNGGGRPSGPVSFMKLQDATGGTIKSGGRVRRAAIMMTMKDWHPDVLQFIRAKAKEEDKAQVLIAAGFSNGMDGEAYTTVAMQNANLSVRLSDEFLKAVEEDGEWATKWVTDPSKSGPTYKAKDLLNEIAKAAWKCGDPGVQYDGAIQHWHTVPKSGAINSSNPCSEYLHLDDTACNLASLNLTKFQNENGSFNCNKFVDAVKVMFLAQEILVDRSSYPTQKVAVNSVKYRPIGLGYTNLGAMLMTSGLPYDSNAGRNLCAAITAVMTGQAYLTSAMIAARMGAFEGYADNKKEMLQVIRNHRNAIPIRGKIMSCSSASINVFDYADEIWQNCIAVGEHHGFRNAQATVLAPTGTISFMMDSDTTGIEPELALVKYKNLAGGGTLTIINQSVPSVLKLLGYNEEDIRHIEDYILKNGTVERCQHLLVEHVPIFDCSLPVAGFGRSISWKGHIKMMAAAQPFVSGAISKTINMPENSTVEDVVSAIIYGWKLKLKAFAMYRDNCKRSQPLNTKNTTVNKEAPPVSPRHRLPDTRPSRTHKFEIDGHEGYFTTGFYENGAPGELFITMAKEGSTVGGLMDAFGTAISLALQHGVPLESMVNKFSYMRFEPFGYTKNKRIPTAKSIIDYIFRWLGMEFGIIPEKGAEKPTAEQPAKAAKPKPTTDAPMCSSCGAITVRAGACFLCHNCGGSSGCG